MNVEISGLSMQIDGSWRATYHNQYFQSRTQTNHPVSFGNQGGKEQYERRNKRYTLQPASLPTLPPYFSHLIHKKTVLVAHLALSQGESLLFLIK